MRGSAAFRVAVAPGGALAGPWVRNSLWTAARAVPSLDLRFAENKSLVDATTGAQLVTFTRASSGTFVGSDGLLRSAVTNLSLRSQELGDAAWTKTLSSITADATIAPNGTTTADKLVEDSSTGTHNIIEAATITYTNGLAYTFSFFIKKAERQTVQIVMHPNPFPGTLAQRTAIFNSNTGAFVSVGSAYTGSSVTAFSDDWYRVSVSSTSDATATGNFPIALCSDDIGTSSYTGDGTSGLFLWGAQLEQASTVGEYIPTTSTINSAPRFDHNPTTGESLGLLVEEARTNLVLRSEEFDSASWTLFGTASRTANTTVAPDGTTTADSVTLPTSSGIFQLLTGSASTTYTFSVWIKCSTTQTVRLVINTNLSDPTTLTVTATSSFQRFSITKTTSVGTLTVAPQIDTGGGNTFVVWGAQLEVGAFPTSYIPTTTATVTRAVDVASITGSNFSSFYNQTEGTVFADINTAPVASIAQAVFDLSEGAGSERIFQRRNTGGFVVTAITDNGVVQGDFGSVSVPASGRARSGLAYRLNDFESAVNGSSSGTDTSATVPTIDRIHIGQNFASGQAINGTIRRLTFWPTRLANPTLQAITQ